MATDRRMIGVAARALAFLLLLVPLAAGAQDGGPSSYWFEVERLNEGLGPAPEGIERKTPQEALASFTDAAREEDWARAAHVLDLTGIDPAEQARRAPLLARQLAQVIERRIWLDWADVSDRPDALMEGGGDSPRAGAPRRSQRLGLLEVDGRPAVLRLNRVKPTGGDPVWVFAEQTVDRIPALHREHGPGRLERAIPEWWNERAGALALRRWELVALPVYYGAAVLLFLALRKVFGWLAHRAPLGMIRNAAAHARVSGALAVAAGLALFGMGRVVTFSAPVSEIAVPILLALVIIGVAMAIVRAIDAVLDIVTRRYVGDIDDSQSRDERHFYTTIYAVRRLVLLIAFIAGVGLLMAQLNLFQSVGISLLASAGVLTVLLGIAGQAVLGNIFASLQIAIAKPIRIGDSVIFDDRWAYVESIFFTFVLLRTWDNRRFVVPVTYFTSEPFENLSMRDAKMTRTFEIVLDHEADPQPVREAFLKLVEEDEDAMPDEMTKMLVIRHEKAGQTLLFYATAPDPSAAWNMHARLREDVLAWLRENHPEWWPREREVEIRAEPDDRDVRADRPEA
ncbi:MAG TPA: mechanosensitive ion channel domain-containing protein [Thermohalobaculum sp.]|nr:mechanosensitive ion channel domain-containing protein [Thermohalobaculum sp.]